MCKSSMRRSKSAYIQPSILAFHANYISTRVVASGQFRSREDLFTLKINQRRRPYSKTEVRGRAALFPQPDSAVSEQELI